jgi:hypothetical protein
MTDEERAERDRTQQMVRERIAYREAKDREMEEQERKGFWQRVASRHARRRR